jgi:hypothetical protein
VTPDEKGSPIRSDAAAHAASLAPQLPLTPEERLSASRENLRAWLVRHQPQREPQAQDAPANESHEPLWLSALFDALSDVPAASVAARWLRRWWNNHPFRAVVDIAAALTREVAGPVAKRHPWWLLLGALAVGVGLTRLRPWRWISGGALLASLMPRFDVAAILHWATEVMTATAAQQAQHQATDDGAEGDAATTSRAAGEEEPSAPFRADRPAEERVSAI